MIDKRLHFMSSLLRPAVALALVFSLTPMPRLLAQVSAISGSQAGAPKALSIVILDGEGALNNIRQRTAREPVVQVQDENHKPVAGATVLFALHSGAGGAGGTFSGATTFSAITGLDGIAVAKGLTPNATRGTYTISVQASVGTVSAGAVITQTNILGALSTATKAAQVHHGIFASHAFLIVGSVAVATAAVVATAVVVTHNNAGATITPGQGTVHP